MNIKPELRPLAGDSEQDQQRALLWRLPAHIGISSASVGGGLGPLQWVLNIGVTRHYARTDLAAHTSEVAQQLGLDDTGSALLTAADISRHRGFESDGVRCDATVGISKPTWAADADDAYTRWHPPGPPGTINIVVQLPVGLEPAAAVNGVVTATEAKSQALFEAAVPGTGTASDAIVICWPAAGPTERFAGPRSVWGARIARAVHGAVAAGIEAASQ